MTLDLERELWDRVARGEWARDVVADMLTRGVIANGKQAHATLYKWASAGLYDYGTALDLGWLKADAVFPRAQ